MVVGELSTSEPSPPRASWHASSCRSGRLRRRADQRRPQRPTPACLARGLHRRAGRRVRGHRHQPASTRSRRSSTRATRTRSRSPTDNVFGIVSLIFWSVTIVVTVTYVLLVDAGRQRGRGRHHGPDHADRAAWRRPRARTEAVAGGAGDLRRLAVPGRQHDHAGDLGAVGGRGPQGRGAVARATWWCRSPRRSSSRCSCVQRFGTASVGRLFGPVMIVWFVVIGACGVGGIAEHPEILRRCRRPTRSDFFFNHFSIAFFALAAVVLAVTGAEALYADMGHFGRAPITRAWLLLVFPACILSYLGQGALILDNPAQHQQPVLPAGARLGALAAGLPGHGGDGDRLAGGDHRRVLGRRTRPSSSAICRACGSRTPPRRRSGRSTCRGSTGC